MDAMTERITTPKCGILRFRRSECQLIRQTLRFLCLWSARIIDRENGSQTLQASSFSVQKKRTRDRGFLRCEFSIYRGCSPTELRHVDPLRCVPTWFSSVKCNRPVTGSSNFVSEECTHHKRFVWGKVRTGASWSDTFLATWLGSVCSVSRGPCATAFMI